MSIGSEITIIVIIGPFAVLLSICNFFAVSLTIRPQELLQTDIRDGFSLMAVL